MIYIGETIRRLGQRVAEHQEACMKYELKKSALAEHAWSKHHRILWDSAKIIDRASSIKERKIKEAIYIQLTRENERLNRDVGLELSANWFSTLRELNYT